MNRRSFLINMATVPVALGLGGCTGLGPGFHGRLVVLRHADRTFAMLNEKGVARAAALPAALADLEIDAIYTTPRQRNIDTATPLAEARGLPVHNLPSSGIGRKLLAAYPGKTVVWVGNQENLGLLYAELGLTIKPPVQFGEIHVVTIPHDGARPSVEKRHYGAEQG